MSGLLDHKILRLNELIDMSLSYDDVLKKLVKAECAYERMLIKNEEILNEFQIYLTENPSINRKAITILVEEFKTFVDGAKTKARNEENSRRAKRAADDKHSKPGGSRDKQEQMRAIWQTGKYTSRDLCAEQECAYLGMSFSTARRALRNIPIT